MRILITGICGFAGSALARAFLRRIPDVEILGLDNLMRPGSQTNVAPLKQLGIDFRHGDIRFESTFSSLPPADWILDAAAIPSVLAGASGDSRLLFQHNLASLGNVLEYARLHRAGLLLLSSSRVYSIPALCALPLTVRDGAFHSGSPGIDANFPTTPPVSLYGATKLACEIMALEYGHAFGFPVWITRCGVLAGAGQFGTAQQGIFSYWIHSHLRRRPLRYTGFDGTGHQTRDALHPDDLARLLLAQIHCPRRDGPRIYTAGGDLANAISLRQLTRWCDQRFTPFAPAPDPTPRLYDVPWIVMDNSAARRDFAWSPAIGIHDILEEIAAHAEAHPNWLELSGQ